MAKVNLLQAVPFDISLELYFAKWGLDGILITEPSKCSIFSTSMQPTIQPTVKVTIQPVIQLTIQPIELTI